MSSTLSQLLVNITILWKMNKKNEKLYKKKSGRIDILHFYSTKENEIDLPEQGLATPKLWVQFQRNTMLNKTCTQNTL